MRAAGAIEALVVFGQQVSAVVAAVWRAHEHVDVVARRIDVVEDDAVVVVELDERHRAVHAVVERIGLAVAAVPGEPRLVEVRRRSSHACDPGRSDELTLPPPPLTAQGR